MSYSATSFKNIRKTLNQKGNTEDHEDDDDDFLLVRELLPRENTIDELFDESLFSLNTILTSDVAKTVHRDVQQYMQELLHNILSRHRLKLHIPAASHGNVTLSSSSTSVRPTSQATSHSNDITQNNLSMDQLNNKNSTTLNINKNNKNHNRTHRHDYNNNHNNNHKNNHINDNKYNFKRENNNQKNDKNPNPRNKNSSPQFDSSASFSSSIEKPIKEIFLDANVPLFDSSSSGNDSQISFKASTLSSHILYQNRLLESEADLALQQNILGAIFERPSKRFQDRIVLFFRNHLNEISKQHENELNQFRDRIKQEFRQLSEQVFQQYLERKRFIERQCGQNIHSLRNAMSKNYLFGRQRIEELENEVHQLQKKNKEFSKTIKSLRDEIDKTNSAYRNMEAANMSLRSQNHDLIEQSRFSNVDRIMDILDALGIPKEKCKDILRKKNGVAIAQQYKLQYEETLNEATNHYEEYKNENLKVQDLEEKISRLESEKASLTNNLEREKKRNTELRKENHERSETLERLEMETFGHSNLTGKPPDGESISEKLEHAQEQIRAMEEKLAAKEQENENLVQSLHEMKLEILDREVDHKEKESVSSPPSHRSISVRRSSNPSISSSSLTGNDGDVDSISADHLNRHSNTESYASFSDLTLNSQDNSSERKNSGRTDSHLSLGRMGIGRIGSKSSFSVSSRSSRSSSEVRSTPPPRPHSVTGGMPRRKSMTTFTVTNGFKQRPRSSTSSRFGNLYRFARLGGN